MLGAWESRLAGLIDIGLRRYKLGGLRATTPIDLPGNGMPIQQED